MPELGLWSANQSGIDSSVHRLAEWSSRCRFARIVRISRAAAGLERLRERSRRSRAPAVVLELLFGCPRIVTSNPTVLRAREGRLAWT